jgi:putative ABC transport system permease protein
MTKKGEKPPAIAAWILARTNRCEDRLSILSDFSEIFEELAGNQGYLRACRWYWAQVARSIPMFILNTLHWRFFMLSSCVKMTWRYIRRHKGFTFINIAGLAIGMASCIIIAAYVRFELSFDRFHEHGDRIFRLVEKQFFEGQDPKELGQSTPWMGETLIEHPEVSRAVNFIDVGTTWTKYGDETIEFRRALLADPDVFSVFSFRMLSGDPQTALSQPNSAVITADVAQRIFGDEDPAGEILIGPAGRDYTVTGVVEDVPPNSHIQFEILISIMEIRNQPVQWENYNHNSPTYLLLKKSADPEALEGKLAGHVQKYFPRDSEQVSLYLQPLRDIHLFSSSIMWEINWQKSDIMYVYFFSLIAVFILVIAYINFINLSTARSVTRAQEVGVRKAVGASRTQLARQFLGESALLSMGALLIALLIVVSVQSALRGVLGDRMAFGFLDDEMFLAGTLLFLVFASILANIYPAFILSSFPPASVLRCDYTLGKKGAGLKKALVMIQFAVSTIMIFSTFVVYQQLRYMQRKDPGFLKAQVINLPMSEAMQQRFEGIRSDLLNNPGTEAVTAATRKLGTPLWRNQILFEGIKPGQQWISPYMAVDYDFLSFYGIELTAGRDFSREFSDDGNSRSYIINETLANQIGWENPIGQKFKLGGWEWGTIIGVAKDFNFRSFHHKIEPVVLVIYRPLFFHMSVKIGTENLNQNLHVLEQRLKPYWNEQPFRYKFLDEDFADFYRNEKRSGRLFAVFSLLAIFISCSGLFALASFITEQKTKEIGIRKVLGSSLPGIVALLSWRFASWVILANLIAWPVAYYSMNKYLKNFAYRIDLSLWTLVLSSLATLAIALLSVSYQSLKAATADPVDSLRYE